MTLLHHGQTQADALADELCRIQELTRSRRHTEALAAACTLLKRVPSQRGALYLSALNQRLLEQAADALKTLDALERVHPHYSLLFQERGHCHVKLGDPARAIVSFERAVALNPALASSWAMLERLLNAAGEPQRVGIASQHLAKLQELPPTIVEAGSWFCDGEHVAAENLLTSYIASQGRNAQALRLLGRIALRRDAADRAANLTRKWWTRAGLRRRMARLPACSDGAQKCPEALPQVDQRLRTAPSNFEARFQRARNAQASAATMMRFQLPWPARRDPHESLSAPARPSAESARPDRAAVRAYRDEPAARPISATPTGASPT